MSEYGSINAVKDFLGGKDRYFGKVNASVISSNGVYYYNNISIRIQYNVPYMQMDVAIIWEDDTTQPSYNSIGLHGMYNSNFQNFIYSNNSLQWEDGDNKILVKLTR